MMSRNSSANFAAMCLLSAVFGLSTGAASAQTAASPRAGDRTDGPSSVPLDAIRNYSFELETCGPGKSAPCDKAAIIVSSMPMLSTPNVSSVAGTATKPASGSMVTFYLTVTNGGPGSARNVKLIESRRTGVNCPDSGTVTDIGGAGLMGGNYTIADLVGPGIILSKLDLGQSATLIYTCQVE